MPPSQRFRRFAIPFRVPLLFSPRMARVTAAETSSREGKRCPRMGSFNMWNNSKSSGFMSGLYGAWGNTSPSYLLSKLVTAFPRYGWALSRKMSGPSPSKSRRFLRIFWVQSRYHAAVTPVPNGTLSWWFLGDHQQRSSFAWPLIALVEIFWIAGRLDFSTRLTAISTLVQSL